MWILDGEKLRQYWDDIAQGFYKDPVELTINLILIGLIIVVPILLTIVATRRGKARSRAEATSRFEAAIAAKGLDQEQAAAVRRLASALSPNPQRWVEVLRRPASFNAAAARAGSALSGELLGRLRWDLGYRATVGALHSTVEVPPGTVCSLMLRGRRIAARVEAVDEEGVHLRSARPVPIGASVVLQIGLPAGLFEAHTTVRSASGARLIVFHSEIEGRIQNRRFFRRRVRGTVELLRDDGSSEKVRLVDLSGGGARLQSTAAWRRGELVTLRLPAGDGSLLSIPSQVIRAGEKSFSLRFDEISDADRDELVRRLR
jgi:hypothetical protein